MSKKVDHTAKSLHYPQRGFILKFQGKISETQTQQGDPVRLHVGEGWESS